MRETDVIPTTSDLLLLECETCGQTFHVRRNVAGMVQVCPNCRHFVVPSEKFVPSIKEVKPPAVFKAVARPPFVFGTRLVEAQLMVHPAGDPVAVIGRFILGFIFGAGAVFGFLLVLPVLVLGFCVFAFLVVALSLVAAYRGPTS